MKRLHAFLYCGFLCLVPFLSAAAQNVHFYVNHVAEENWTTSITVFNTGPDAATFDLYRWDTGGTETVMPGISVPGFSSLTLTNVDFGYHGTAMVSAAPDAPFRSDWPTVTKTPIRCVNSS